MPLMLMRGQLTLMSMNVVRMIMNKWKKKNLEGQKEYHGGLNAIFSFKNKGHSLRQARSS